MNCAPILCIQQWISTPHLSWAFIAVATPEVGDESIPFFDLHRAEGADFEVGGRRFVLFAHDFRRLPADAWLELMFERDRTGAIDLGPAAAHAPALLVLSEAEFGDAVRGP